MKNRDMIGRSKKRSKRDERGASIIVIALSMVIIAAGCAFALDIANLSFERQTLQNTVDAAAQAGTTYLPKDAKTAISEATSYAQKNLPGLAPKVESLCIVGSKNGGIAPGHIPATCNPTGGATQTSYKDQKCNSDICVIPCDPVAGRCNSLRVTASQEVKHWFAPIIGINSTNTGAVSSTSCKGACGTLMPNAMDIALIADRTGSMRSSDLDKMRSGISDSLLTMTPEYQFVNFMPLHKSKTNAAGCKTAQAGGPKASGFGLKDPRDGVWNPLQFSNDFLNGNLGDGVRTINASSEMVKGINCFDSVLNGTGTHLAAPLKQATRLLLEKDPSNLGSLSAARATKLPEGAKVTKAIILETDGVPEETIGDSDSDKYYTRGLGSTDINVGGTTAIDIGTGDFTNHTKGCENLVKVANQAKAQGILVITVGFGMAIDPNAVAPDGTKKRCGGVLAGKYLAQAATEKAPGVPSAMEGDCSTTAGATKENTDGDNFYCAATADQLREVFASAITSIGGQTRFVRVPA